MLKKKNNTNLQFNQWLAGFIDGDGYFHLSKKGYASFEITVDIRDKACLYHIKDKYGGSFKLKQSLNFVRYRLHHKKGLLDLIESINGLIHNPVRLLQLSKICNHYNIILIYPKPLTYDNAWLSGFIDSDGSIYLNTESVQIFITASQKNKLLLDPLVNLYGGTIYTLSKTQAFKWTVFKKDHILNLEKYLKKYPLKSKKMVRLRLISKIYDCFKMSGHKSSVNSIQGKLWGKLIKKWNNYG